MADSEKMQKTMMAPSPPVIDETPEQASAMSKASSPSPPPPGKVESTRPTALPSAAFTEQLPKGVWTVLDMFKFPDTMPESELDHGAIVAGLARTPAKGGAANFAPGEVDLAREAPIGWFEEFIAVVALGFFFTAPAAGPAAVVLALACALRGMYVTCLVTLALVGVLTLWAPTLSPGSKHNYIVSCIYRYFSFRIVFHPDSQFTCDRSYIHVCGPHALFPIGGLLWQLSPWKTSRYHGRAGVASAVTRLPLWRQLFFAFGCEPAERSRLSRLLRRGLSTGVAVDGIAGIFADAARPHSQPALVMAKRKGVVRLGKIHGTPLVPVWFFVSRRPLRNLLGTAGEWLSRKFQVSLVLPYGRFGPGLPPVPRRAAITVVVGKPVEVGAACENPTADEVDALHAKLCAEMTAAFDSQKAAFGWDGRSLEII